MPLIETGETWGVSLLLIFIIPRFTGNLVFPLQDFDFLMLQKELVTKRQQKAW